MEIWLDTCNTKTIAAGNDLGFIFGVTTNPSILAASPNDPETTIKYLLDVQFGPIAVQVLSETASEMYQEAIALRRISERILVKIPVTVQGLITMRQLKNAQIPVMATAIFHPRQALLAALNGAQYAAPYLGRMFDDGIEAYTSLQSMINLLKQYNLPTKIIAAALRTTDQIMACGEMGVQAVTLKSSLFDQLIEDDALTMKSLRSFRRDWESQSRPALVSLT